MTHSCQSQVHPDACGAKQCTNLMDYSDSKADTSAVICRGAGPWGIALPLLNNHILGFQTRVSEWCIRTARTCFFSSTTYTLIHSLFLCMSFCTPLLYFFLQEVLSSDDCSLTAEWALEREPVLSPDFTLWLLLWLQTHHVLGKKEGPRQSHCMVAHTVNPCGQLNCSATGPCHFLVPAMPILVMLRCFFFFPFFSLPLNDCSICHSPFSMLE